MPKHGGEIHDTEDKSTKMKEKWGEKKLYFNQLFDSNCVHRTTI